VTERHIAKPSARRTGKVQYLGEMPWEAGRLPFEPDAAQCKQEPSKVNDSLVLEIRCHGLPLPAVKQSLCAMRSGSRENFGQHTSAHARRPLLRLPQVKFPLDSDVHVMFSYAVPSTEGTLS